MHFVKQEETPNFNLNLSLEEAISLWRMASRASKEGNTQADKFVQALLPFAEDSNSYIDKDIDVPMENDGEKFLVSVTKQSKEIVEVISANKKTACIDALSGKGEVVKTIDSSLYSVSVEPN